MQMEMGKIERKVWWHKYKWSLKENIIRNERLETVNKHVGSFY